MSFKCNIDKNLEYILAFEKAGKHHKLITYGINVWPIIRAELQFNVLRNANWFNAQGKINSVKLGFFSKIKTRLIVRNRFSRIKKNVESLKLKKTSVLLFSPGNAYYTDTINGKLYNRHIDPFLEELEKLTISSSKFHVINEAEVNNKFLPSDNLIFTKDFQDFIWHHSCILNSQFYNSHLTSLLNDLGINESYFYKRVCLIISLKEIFKIVLKKKMPSTLGVVCFYDENCFAMILAAKELGIKTFDIQHGKQGGRHFCYSHIVSANESVKSLMPDFFWNWEQDSIDNIQHYLHNKSDISCVAGGNLWMSKWKNNNFHNPSIDEKEYVENLKKYDKTFLYTAQPLNDYVMPDFFKEIIKKNPTYFFGIRLHPRDKISLNSYIKEFEEFSNVEIKLSTDMPLYYLLKNINFSVTRWSSVALEALCFNCTSVLIDAFGIESYQSYVDKGLMLSVLSESDFDKIIFLKKPEYDVLENSIIINPTTILNKLKTIVVN